MNFTKEKLSQLNLSSFFNKTNKGKEIQSSESNKKNGFQSLITDFQGHYDLDGVSYENGNIYLGSYFPLTIRKQNAS